MTNPDQETMLRPTVEAAVIDVLAMIFEMEPEDIRLDMRMYSSALANPDTIAEFEKSGDALEVDSLDALELTFVLEGHFHVGVPEEIDYSRFKVVSDIVDFVMERGRMS